MRPLFRLTSQVDSTQKMNLLTLTDTVSDERSRGKVKQVKFSTFLASTSDPLIIVADGGPRGACNFIDTLQRHFRPLRKQPGKWNAVTIGP